MLIGFDAFVNKVIKTSGEKCKSVVRGTYDDHIIKIAILYAFYTSFSFNMVIFSSYKVLFLVLYVLITIFVLFMISTRKIGFGMTDSRLVYVKFNHIGYKDREVYEILFDKIKYLDVKRIFGMTYVKMSFIDETGKFKKLKFRYAPIVIGMSVDEQKTHGLRIWKKLEELQKVLDRGDF
jgi:hypothetical protein